jgi:cell wall-associated NlpC family hydrolase
VTYRPLPVRLSRVVWGIASRARRRQATLVVVALLASMLAALAADVAKAEPPAISAKRAEARRVLGEIHALDVQMEKAIEAYNGATEQLAAIERESNLNAEHLVIAKHNLYVSQRRLGVRLRALYTGGEENSTLAILLGSHSIGDFLNRVETVNSVSSQDSQVIAEVKQFKHDVVVRAEQLKIAHARQEKVVAERAAARQQVESGLAERQRLLDSIQGEIARLQREEAERQARLAAEARARLQAQLAAQQRAVQAAQAQDVVGASAVSPDGAVTVVPPSQYAGVVGIAMQYLGVPYVWGGASPGGFDCSGFVMFVFAQVGVSLPHHAASIYNYGVPVSRDQLEPGDLVFFDGLGHMGIYIGNGQFVHAPHTGDVVKISSLNDSWYAATYVGAKRIT